MTAGYQPPRRPAQVEQLRRARFFGTHAPRDKDRERTSLVLLYVVLSLPIFRLVQVRGQLRHDPCSSC
jgi:hypothetical protein